jgi:hypothetical protein
VSESFTNSSGGNFQQTLYSLSAVAVATFAVDLALNGHRWGSSGTSTGHPTAASRTEDLGGDRLYFGGQIGMKDPFTVLNPLKVNCQGIHTKRRRRSPARSQAVNSTEELHRARDVWERDAAYYVKNQHETISLISVDDLNPFSTHYRRLCWILTRLVVLGQALAGGDPCFVAIRTVPTVETLRLFLYTPCLQRSLRLDLVCGALTGAIVLGLGALAVVIYEGSAPLPVSTAQVWSMRFSK